MAKNQKRWAEIIRRFRGTAVGVLGDYMLDELLRGDATRISPEAPVPVVRMKDGAREGYPGGAGNVAANVRSLAGRPIIFGAIGTDESGKRLCNLLKHRNISSKTLFQERGRVTPRKVRIVAHQQQLLRLDFESPQEASELTQRRISRAIGEWSGRLKSLIISDYQKGSVTTEVAASAISSCRQKRIPIFVDPKPDHPEICRHATVVTPNLHEAELMLGQPMKNWREILEGGRRLIAQLGCANLLITRGSEGMALFESDGSAHEIPGIARPVYDVTGAGDTVIAVLALAVSAGADLKEAATLANLAGGRVVLKFGTSEITPQELLQACAGPTDLN